MISTESTERLVSLVVFGEFTLADYKEFEDVVNYRIQFSGPVDLRASVTLAALEAMDEAARDACLRPVDVLLADWPAVQLGEADAARFLSGMRRRIVHADAEHVRVYGPDGRSLLGGAHVKAGELIADRLLSPLEVRALRRD